MLESTKTPQSIRRHIVIALSIGLVAAFWLPTFDFYFKGFDWIRDYIGFSKARILGYQISNLLTPQVQYFLPVNKVFLFLEWKFFGLEVIPYHITSIALMLLSAWLLWRVLLGATGHALASWTCAIAYATNTAYYTMVASPTLQGLLLMFIFIELSLLKMQDLPASRYAAVPAAFFCLIASLIFPLGASAWLLSGLYAILMVRPHEGWSLRRLTSSTWPLMISGAISITLMVVFKADLSGEYGSTTIDPVTHIQGVLLLTGAGILQSIKTNLILSLIPGMKGLSPTDLRALIFGHSILAAGVAAIFFRKLPAQGKRMVLFGIIAAASWCMALIATRANYYGDLMKLIQVSRHSYFALVFLTFAAAPFLALLSAKAWRFMPVVLIIWIGLHLSLLLKGAELYKSANQAKRDSIDIISRSLDYPVRLDIYGRPTLSLEKDRESRQLVDYSLAEESGYSYSDALWMFLGPGELIANGRGNHYLLRNSRDLDTASIMFSTGVPRPDESSIQVSSDVPIEMSVDPGALAPVRPSNSSLPYALTLRLRSSNDGRGLISCANNDKKDEFTLSKGKKVTIMAVFCNPLPDARITLPAGTYSLSDAKLFW